MEHFLLSLRDLRHETVAVVIVQLLTREVQSANAAFFFLNHPVKCVELFFLVSVLSAIFLQLTQRSYFKTSFTHAMFQKVFVVGLPLLSSSLTDSLLFVNSPCHWNVVARNTADSPNTFRMFSYIFVTLQLSFTQNCIAAHWSTFSSRTIITQITCNPYTKRAILREWTKCHETWHVQWEITLQPPTVLKISHQRFRFSKCSLKTYGTHCEYPMSDKLYKHTIMQ